MLDLLLRLVQRFMVIQAMLAGRLYARTSEGAMSAAYLYRRLYEYVRPYRLRAMLAMAVTIPIGFLDSAVALVLKPYVDMMQSPTAVAINLAMIPVAVVGFTMVQGMFNYLSIYLNGWLGIRIMSDLRRDLFWKLQTLDVAYFDAISTGAVIQQYFRDPESIQANVLDNAKQVLVRVFAAISLTGVLFYTSWKLALIAVSIVGLILYPSIRIRRRIKDLSQVTVTAAADLINCYSETVGGIKTIYGFNLPEHRLRLFAYHQDIFRGLAMRTVQAQGWLSPSMHFIASIGVGLVLWQGSLMILSRELTTGAFVSFMAATLMLYNPIKNLGSSILSVHISLFAAGRVFRLLDQTPTIRDKPGAIPLEVMRVGITLENVTFRYRSEAAPVLEDVTMFFEKGKTTALVGHSGGGKSTIAHLIPRFYEVTEGRVLIDDVPLPDFQIHALRAKMALVTQDSFVFGGTLRDNLRVGKWGASDEEMMAALEKAYLDTFVKQLPRGLMTPIGERGVMLSGGQRQRLAIARVFLKDAPIVILDEATSALDSQSEMIVQQAMQNLMRQRTVIVIAHRLSTIQHADRIIVIDHGRVVEQGTHGALLAQNGPYARLYRAQFQRGETTVPAAPVS